MAVTVGLDIGTSSVRAAVVDTAKGKAVVRRYAEMPLPPGAVVAGEILDVDAVAETVAALWKRAKLPKKRVVVGSASQKLVVRQVDVPQMGESELMEALPFQVQDSIPIAVEDAMLDFIPLEEFSTPEGEPMQSILAIAVHRDVVQALVAVTEAAKISLLAIDLQAFGLIRAVFGLEHSVEDPYQAIVDIGGSVTQLIIAKGGTARFVRMLPTGGEQFTNALVEGLDLSFAEADVVKRRVGVAAGEPAIGEEPDDVARRLLTTQADRLIDEIRGSVNFFASQSSDSIARVVVAGNAARLPHLANRLGQKLALPIVPAKILERVEIGRVGLSETEMLDAQPVLPTGVGLGLWGER